MGRIGAAHGIKGEVRLTSFTQDPRAIAGYGPLTTDREGLSIEIESLRESGNALIARLKGVTDRTEAEKLNGLSLHLPRERLPEPDADDFYHADLIGLEVVLETGETLGTVAAVADFGAGDLLDIERPGGAGSVYLPFTREIVPTVDLPGRRLVARPPAGWLEEEAEPGPTEPGP